MKLIILSLLLLIMSTPSDSQPTTTSELPPATAIRMFPIQVTVNKTTNILFPYPVKNVDRGVESLLVQKVEGAEHILQLKAASGDMPETNMSVVTADRRLYSFVIRYDTCPHTLNWDFKSGAFGSLGYVDGSPFIVHEKLSEAERIQLAQTVAEEKPFLKRVKDSDDGITLKLNGLYVSKDVFFFSLQLENGTAIAYDVESLQVFIRDKKNSNRTAVQAVALPRLLAWGDSTLIDSHTGQRLVLVLPKFTIPDKKECVIQLREANGGRHLECRFRNRHLIRAREIH